MAQNCASENLARNVVVHAVDGMFENCSNSYVNAYLQSWLVAARKLGAYPEPLPLIGRMQDVRAAWDDWLEEHFDEFEDLTSP